MSSPSVYQYTVGGALRQDAPSYIARQADADLFNTLLAREYCHIFNARQMGKSSLRVQTTHRLQSEGIACGIIEVSAIVEHGMTSEAWYLGVIRRLSRSLGIKFKILPWWRERDGLPPSQRFSEFIEDVLFKEIQQPIVIFIDEIDSLFQFDFNDDFFSLIRNFYQERAEHSDYRRLTIALLGVATPSELIAAPNRTPFNIGTAIQLKGFTLAEAKPLSAGMAHLSEYPVGLIEAILRWTGGQPFLTQKLCQLVVSGANIRPKEYPAPYIDKLVQKKVIEDWLQQDTPEHLKTIQDRILHSHQAQRLLEIYQDVLKSRLIPLDGSPEQSELQLTGLVVKEGHYLRVANRIYATVFKPWWVDNQLTHLCPYQDALNRWLASGCDDQMLLSDRTLKDARAWAGSRTLSEEHHQFLMNSQTKAHDRAIARQESIKEQAVLQADAIAARSMAKVRQLFTISLVLFVLSGVMLAVTLLLTLRLSAPAPDNTDSASLPKRIFLVSNQAKTYTTD